MAYLQKQGLGRSGYAANKDRENLAAAWKWGGKYLDNFPQVLNPFPAVEKLKEERSPRCVPPENDFWRVVEISAKQDRTMLPALFYPGAGRGEIFRLKREDIDFLNNRVRPGTRKTRDGSMRYDWSPLAGELKASVLDWKERRPHKAPWVFTAQEDTPNPHSRPGEPYRVRAQFMRPLCGRAGVKPFGYHPGPASSRQHSI